MENNEESAVQSTRELLFQVGKRGHAEIPDWGT